MATSRGNGAIVRGRRSSESWYIDLGILAVIFTLFVTVSLFVESVSALAFSPNLNKFQCDVCVLSASVTAAVVSVAIWVGDSGSMSACVSHL